MSVGSGNAEGASSLPTGEAPAAGATLVGYLVPFNRWAEIDHPSEGHFLERFVPGSLARTFTEDRSRIRVLFQHGRDGMIGDKPLGQIVELAEDERGGRFQVSLFDTQYVRELIPGLRGGQYGVSLRFKVLDQDLNRRPHASAYNRDRLPERTIREAQVREFGPVTWPAYEGTEVGLRSVTDWRVLGGETRDDPDRQLVLRLHPVEAASTVEGTNGARAGVVRTAR